MKEKPEVGQTLYSLNIGNAARYCEQVLTPVTVTKVGRKYFTIGEGRIATQYHLDTWHEKTEFSAGSRIYRSPQEWADEKEADSLAGRIHDVFRVRWRCPDVPLDKLRQIAQILGIESEQ